MEDVAVICCGICWSYFEYLVAFKRCPHMICRTCYDRVDECPLCKTPKGTSLGKNVNVASCSIVRREEIQANFGVTTQDLQAAEAANGRRPADISDREWNEQLDREAINRALRHPNDSDTSDDDDVQLRRNVQNISYSDDD